MFDRDIKLIYKVANSKDTDGFPSEPLFVFYEAYAERKSVKQSEYYKANQVGLKAVWIYELILTDYSEFIDMFDMALRSYQSNELDLFDEDKIKKIALSKGIVLGTFTKEELIENILNSGLAVNDLIIVEDSDKRYQVERTFELNRDRIELTVTDIKNA